MTLFVFGRQSIARINTSYDSTLSDSYVVDRIRFCANKKFEFFFMI